MVRDEESMSHACVNSFTQSCSRLGLSVIGATCGGNMLMSVCDKRYLKHE